jgi:hypothetical protein
MTEEENQQEALAHEAEIVIPGSFVVLQGMAGDGMANTIDSFPILSSKQDKDDQEDCQAQERGVVFYDSKSELQQQPSIHNRSLLPQLSTLSVKPLQTTTSGRSIPVSNTSSPADSFILVDGSLTSQEKRLLEEEEAIQKWNLWRLQDQEHQRLDWLAMQDSTAFGHMAWMKNDRWWLDEQGRVKVFDEFPCLVDGRVNCPSKKSLSPGSTVVGVGLTCVKTSTLEPQIVFGNFSLQASVFPRGKPGWIQILRIESPVEGFVVLSVDGYANLGPGLVSLYIDPLVWTWRVTCSTGAYVREGLGLESRHVETLPYGSFMRVTRKMVNDDGLRRLRMHAIVEGDAASHVVEGWVSEALNPRSGQQGSIAQPVPFPVPALFRVTLSSGAVIRSGVELSSTQIGHAPVGTILTIVGRAFSEHPRDHCVERLKLAGNGGWISLRLCKLPPQDELVVQLIGVDGGFDPDNPGEYHLEAQRKVQQEVLESSSSQQPSRPSGTEDLQDGDLSEIGSADSSPSNSPPAKITRTRPSTLSRSRPPPNRQDDVCLICLTEERNATIIHGETGHICCCLHCARILKHNGDRCPVCRLSIDHVIQHFYA